MQGNLINRIMERTPSEPRVGEGATICHWSDRDPATVVRVSPSGKTAWIQEDRATRTDKNGMSECQEYTYERAVDAPIHKVVRVKKGWKIAGGCSHVTFGLREKYHDFSF